MMTYEWQAPNGVKVVSVKPEVEEKWWDDPKKHLIWSYSSWITWILADYGFWAPRKFLARRGWWK